MDLNTTFLKGRMNKSLDERVLPDGEYIDALNIRIGSTENNSVGAIENSLGNTKIVSILYEGQELSTDARCIGAYEDSQHETIYWFVTDPGNVDMVLSYNERTGTLIYHVISTTVLNFSTEFLINGIDLIDNLLFWTDNYNPPRKINVNIPYLYPTLGIDNITDDDISVIVQPPIEAPEISPFIISGDENYMSERFISFSYRYKYRDGEYSALSQFSNIAFEPESFFVDYTTYTNGSMVNVFNSYNISFNTGGKNVVGIDVCFKLSDSSIVNIIEKFDKLDNGWGDNQVKSIQFDNKKIYTVLPNSELTRLFDNVPLTAKSQTTMGNRLIYGNYVDGYDIDTVIDYTLSAESEDNLEEEIVVRPLPGQYTLGGSRTIPDTIIELDFTGVDIKNGSVLSIQFSLFHNDFAGDPTYESAGILNSYEETFNFNITQDYANAYALANDPFFIEKVYVHKPITECAEGFSLTDDFNCSLTTIQTSPPEWDVNGTGITSIDQGFTIISSPSQPNIIKIQIPAIKFSGTDDPNPVLYAYEYLSDTGTTAVLSKLNSKRSLHSNRDYEVGIVYQDKYLRSTTALVCKNNTVFFPASTSDKKNYIVATINNLAPSWAERYKFVVKPSKSKYETLYTNLFFQDGNGFSWFKLEGENISKARVGERLIVKRDSNGALEVLTTIDILDVQAQSNNFISGPNTSNIINEPSGVYMKIRASNFEAIYEKESFVSIEGTNKTPRNYQAAGWNLSYVNPDFIPANPVSSTNQPLIPHDIPAGSLIKFDIGMNRNHRGSKCGGRTYKFQKTIVASQDYDNFYLFCQGEGIDFEKGVVTSRDNTVNTNEYNRSLSVPYKRTGSGSTFNPIVYPLFPAEASVNKFQFFRQYLNPDSPTVPTGGLFFLARSGTPSCDSPDFKGSDTSGTITIQKATGLFVFETESLDADGEIYYEGSDSFPIVNGYHMSGDAPGDTDQTSTDPAVVTLNFFDCFSFANGVESYKIKDSIVGAPFYLGERVTAVAQEDYMSSDRYATITYSGIYNAETNINKLNEFNLSLANFKDLEKSFGPINRLYARRTDILVLQEDKISYVLAGKNLLSDSAGGGNIASIPEVIGTQIARIEDYGISNNPESFAVFGGEVYFTDIKRNSVLNLRGGSAQSDALSVVSDMGMKYWFRDEFKNSQNYFKIGGYDPYMDEYVLHLTETAMPTELDVYGCGVTISKQNINGVYEFKVELSDEIGAFNIDLSLLSGDVQVIVNYNDVDVYDEVFNVVDDYVITIPKTTSLDKYVIVKIISNNASYSFNTGCVFQVDYITVYKVVVNSPEAEDSTIHNQHRWSLGSYTSPNDNDFIIMEADGISLFESNFGGLSQGMIPADGANITMVSQKRSEDTFIFNPLLNSFKYLVSNTLYSVNDLIPLLNTATPIVGNYQATINSLSLIGFDYLYLVWDYRNILEVTLCYSESNVFEVCCDCDASTYYIDSDQFSSATGVWLDELQTELAPDGLYLLDGTYRQLLSGVLLDPVPCTGCGCECYTVTYVEPSGAVEGITEFSYFNCEGVLVNSEVGDGESAPTSLDVCAKENSITLTGGDESATWAATTGVNCCVSFFPSRISGTPDPSDGCAATLNTDCWVSNVNTSTPGQEMPTSSSFVYIDPNGDVPFPGITGQYKIKINGSSVCTSNAVASNGRVTILEGICFSCQ
jgi:hypothetical protein